MVAQIHPDLKRRMLALEGLTESEGSNYAQYDEIRIDLAAGKATFLWLGRPQLFLVVPHMCPGDILILSDLEGRMKVSLA